VLHVYDLSNGLARQMSQAFLGKQIDGIWHTGVVSYGKEFFFGGGIQVGMPGRTPYGHPVDRIDLGETRIPEDVFIEFLNDISPRFSMDTYDLLRNNCNHFSQEAAKFLTGKSIPDYITGLPDDVMQTPLGGMIRQMLDRVQDYARQNAGTSMPVFTEPTVTAHPHASLELPFISSYDKPFLLHDKGDNGQMNMSKLRSLHEARHRDAGTEATSEESRAMDALEEYLKLPVDCGEPLPRECYRFLAKILAEWPVHSWGPVLEIFRLLMLYSTVNSHYANSSTSPTSIIIKRCLAAHKDVPKIVQLRGIFVATNVFSYSHGAKMFMQTAMLGEAIDCGLELVGREDMALRMSAAALLYNIALHLPKVESIEMVQLLSGMAHTLSNELDEETEFRLLLAISKLIYCNSAAQELVKSLDLRLESKEGAMGRREKVMEEINKLLQS